MTDATIRPILADWIVDGIHKGNYTEFQFIPLFIAAKIRATGGSWLYSQFIADIIIGIVFGTMFCILFYRLVRSSLAVTGHIYSLCRETPTVILSLIGLIITGIILSFMYSLSVHEFPAQHAAVYEALAIVAMTIVNFFVRIGNALRGATTHT